MPIEASTAALALKPSACCNNTRRWRICRCWCFLEHDVTKVDLAALARRADLDPLLALLALLTLPVIRSQILGLARSAFWRCSRI